MNADEHATTSQRVERLVRSFVEDLNSKDLDRIGAWFHDESVVWIPPAKARIGRKRIVRMMSIIFDGYQRINWEIERIHVISDTLTVYAVRSDGVFADGQPYSNHIMTELELTKAGLISNLSDYFKDTGSFRRPLGQ